MKVVFVTTESFIDHSFTMIRELRKHVDMETIIIAKKITPEIQDFCAKIEARFKKRKRFINPLRLVFEFRLLSYIKRQKADLVWFNTLSLVQAILLKLFIGNPLITAHDVEIHPDDTDYHGKLSQKLTFRLFKKCIAVMSQSQANLFERKYGLKPYLLRLPIIDYYENSAEQKNAKRVLQTVTRFLFFGSILPYKGIETLLNAVRILNSTGIEFELNIAGALKYDHETLANKIADLNNVNHINKHIDYKDVHCIYKNCDAVIVPYTQVTQSGPLLIAYNQHKPCITSDLPGFREYMVDGKSGLIYSNTPEDLASKMQFFIENKTKLTEMSVYITNEMTSKFSMRSLAQSYLDVFKRHIS